MKEVQAILFDLDNTLMDRDNTFRSFCTQFVQDFLGHLEPAEAQDVIEDMIYRDADGYRDKDGFFIELSEILPWETPVTAEHIRAYYDASYINHGATMKDAVDILKYCKERGYILGLVTNGKVEIQNTKIDTLGLREYFKAIVISGEVGVAKPDPKIYQLALDRLGVTADQTYFIGDHPVNDIWGAGKAGLQGIWLQRKHAWDEQLDIQPWKIICELDELKSIL